MGSCPLPAAKGPWSVAVFLGLLLLASLATSVKAQGQHSVCQSLDPSPTLTQFLDELPIPPTISVSTGKVVTLGTYKITQKLHSQLPPTTLYAYGTSQATAMYPGPTLEALRYVPALVHYENHIRDTEPFLVVDRTIHWANPPHGGVPVVPHLHGAEDPPQYDGNPDAWFTAFGDRGPGYVTQNYEYPNSQPPALLWYHDHAMGITRINVLAGLAGLYFIRSPSEEPPHLPSGPFEIPLVIQDKQFWPNGSINFPDIGNSPAIHPNWCPEYFGDTILVNGIAWPYLNVYPTKYRFRVLNAANARFFNLSLSDPSLSITQIGTDGGYLPKPLVLSSITLAPAYRVDLIIDFSKVTPGNCVYLNNSAPAPYPSGDPSVSPPQTNSVLEFKVIPKPLRMLVPEQIIPASFGPDAQYPANYESTSDSGSKQRQHNLTEANDALGNPVGTFLDQLRWTDPVTNTPQLGTIEIWNIINFTPDGHPIHLHLIAFLVLSQQQFNQTAYDAGTCSLHAQFPNTGTCFTEYPQPPDATQVGWKDTVIVLPSKVTRFWTRWTSRRGGPFPFDATAFPGYAWHCHILGHEDNEMMGPLKPTLS